ncbi:MAG: head GIN domain-containing protein [Parvularculaceae bacterium]
MTGKTALLTASAITLLAASAAYAETQNFSFTDFTGVSVSAGVDADIAVGGDYSVVAEGSDKALERLKMKVSNGELQIGRKATIGWRRGDDVHVSITMPSMQALEVSSGASADVTGVDAGSFDIDVSSGGSADVAGTCEDLNVDVSSGGDIDARSLECRNAVADASSGGSADIYASESINGDASSGGSVDIYGSPQRIGKNTSSGGSVSVK